jgi:ferredoxin
VNAIVPDNDTDIPNLVHWLEVNSTLSKVCPTITKRKDPLATAEEFKDIKDKQHLLEK